MRELSVRVLVLALVVSGLTGCTAGAVTPEVPSVPSTTEGIGPLTAMTRLSKEQSKAVFDATQHAVASCMRSRGFSYRPYPYESPSGDAESAPAWGDVSRARSHGYGFQFSDRPDGQGAGGAQVEDQTAGMSPAQRAAWNSALKGKVPSAGAMGGDPDIVTVEGKESTAAFSRSSCLTYGAEQVQGDTVTWMKAQMRYEELAGEAHTRAEADPRVAAMMRDWSSCMRKRGFTLEKPDAARSFVADQVRSGALPEAQGRVKEIEVAVADAECANSVRGQAVLDQAEADAERAVLSVNQNDVMAFAELQKKAVERATTQAGA